MQFTLQCLQKKQNKLYSLSQKYPEFKTIYKNTSAYPESLLVSLCNTPEMIDFVKDYPNADNKSHEKIRTYR